MKESIITGDYKKERVESLFLQHTWELQTELQKRCQYKKALREAFDLYGGYEILLEAKEIYLRKTEFISSNDFLSDFKDTLIGIAYNIIRNKVKSRHFKDFLILNRCRGVDKVNLTDEEDIEYFSSNEVFDSEVNGLPGFLDLVKKINESLDKGDYNRCNHLFKYMAKKIESEKQSDLKDAALGILLYLKGNYFLERGKLSLGRKNVFSAHQLLLSSPAIFGETPLIMCSNTLARLDLFSGNTKTGAKLLLDNLRLLQKRITAHPSTEMSKLYGQIHLKASAFYGNIPTNEANATELKYFIKQFWKETDYDLSERVSQLYSKSYILIDTNQSEKAIELLEFYPSIELLLHSDKIPKIDKMRYYYALSEALTIGFRNEDARDLTLAWEALQKGDMYNKGVKSKYFLAMSNLLHGYIENNPKLMQRGIQLLKIHGHLHFCKWYSDKTKFSLN